LATAQRYQDRVTFKSVAAPSRIARPERDRVISAQVANREATYINAHRIVVIGIVVFQRQNRGCGELAHVILSRPAKVSKVSLVE
jgi:hypothetical protein